MPFVDCSLGGLLSGQVAQILELVEHRDDAAASRFGWRLLLICGDLADPSTYFAGFPKDQVSPISCPDNVAFDPYGNLWIATDVAVQHPGELAGATVENPASVRPDGPGHYVRPSVVSVQRHGNRRIGDD